MNQEGNVTVVELAKKDAYLREIGSKHSTSHYYDVLLHRGTECWSIELTRKAFEKTLEKSYHGKLFEADSFGIEKPGMELADPEHVRSHSA